MKKQDFKEEVAIIQYAKYEGSRRLNFQADSSLVMFVMFSMCVLTASIIFLVYPDLGKEQQKLISLVVSILTINSIAFQLFAFGRKYSAKSKELFLCGDKLSELVREIDRKFPDNDDQVSEEVISKYDEILARFSAQHKVVDYKLAKHWVKDTPILKNLHHYLNRNFVKYRLFIFFVLSSMMLSISIIYVVNQFT